MSTISKKIAKRNKKREIEQRKIQESLGRLMEVFDCTNDILGDFFHGKINTQQMMNGFFNIVSENDELLDLMR
jgi:hypothetical protein